MNQQFLKVLIKTGRLRDTGNHKSGRKRLVSGKGTGRSQYRKKDNEEDYELTRTKKSGVIVRGKKIEGGISQAYRQEETGW